MAVIIRARCDTCGPVGVPIERAEFWPCLNRTELSYWRFTCERCNLDQKHVTTVEAAEMLRATKIKTLGWRIPEEALETKHGLNLTSDDLLDFCLGLHQSDFISDYAMMEALGP